MIMYKIVLLLFSLTIISCNNRNDKNQIVEKVNKVAVDSILNLPPDKKLFLDFATGISEAQFNVLINLSQLGPPRHPIRCLGHSATRPGRPQS